MPLFSLALDSLLIGATSAIILSHSIDLDKVVECGYLNKAQRLKGYLFKQDYLRVQVDR